MIRKIRNSAFTKVLWGLMGFYLLNISVDPADPNPQSVPEDLSINDQESIIELVVEQLLGFEDIFEEFDDHDTQDHSKKATIKVDLMIPCLLTAPPLMVSSSRQKQKFPNHTAAIASGFRKLDSPPPNS